MAPSTWRTFRLSSIIDREASDTSTCVASILVGPRGGIARLKRDAEHARGLVSVLRDLLKQAEAQQDCPVRESEQRIARIARAFSHWQTRYDEAGRGRFVEVEANGFRCFATIAAARELARSHVQAVADARARFAEERARDDILARERARMRLNDLLENPVRFRVHPSLLARKSTVRHASIDASADKRTGLDFDATVERIAADDRSATVHRSSVSVFATLADEAEELGFAAVADALNVAAEGGDFVLKSAPLPVRCWVRDRLAELVEEREQAERDAIAEHART